jgi:hypothetical protein
VDRETAIYKAGKIAEAFVIIHNAINGAGTSGWQPENANTVDWFVNSSASGDRIQHFRFEYARNAYTIRDMMMDGLKGNGVSLYRSQYEDRALVQWVQQIHAYTL